MGREYPTDTLWRAQELYCVDRLSYAAVAEATGVSATTLKAWGHKYGWARRREEIARAESEIRVNIIKGRQKALEQLLAAEDAKEAAPMAFAVSSLESLALKRQELRKNRLSGRTVSQLQPRRQMKLRRQWPVWKAPRLKRRLVRRLRQERQRKKRRRKRP